jgi:IS30 family transposase
LSIPEPEPESGQTARIMNWMNNCPGKVLGYGTPLEAAAEAVNAGVL